MTEDRRRGVIDRMVIDLAALEGEIAEALSGWRDVASGHPESSAAIDLFITIAESHGDTLRDYLAGNGALTSSDSGGEETSPAPETAVTDASHAAALSEALRVCLAKFGDAVGAYAALTEAAFRLYDPELRKLAPTHLDDYARAVRSVTKLIPAVTAMELAEVGLGCHCVCPMCTIGACGCVAVAISIADESWGGANEPAAQGFPLLKPRAGSQLAEKGLEAGDRLVEVDGVEVNSFQEVQNAIRNHQLGEEVRFLISREGGQPREIRVRHLHDY